MIRLAIKLVHILRSKKYYQKFYISRSSPNYFLYTKVMQLSKTATYNGHVSIYKSEKTMLCSSFFPYKGYNFFLKPKLSILKNAYISEQFFIFTKKHKVIRESLAYFFNLSDATFNLFGTPNLNSFWIQVKKKYYQYIFQNDTWSINYFLHKPYLNHEIRRYSKQTFCDKNTMHTYFDKCVFTFLTTEWYNFGHFMTSMLPNLIHHYQNFSLSQKKNLYIILPKFNEGQPVSKKIFLPITDALEIERDKILWINHGEMYQFKKIYYAEQVVINPDMLKETWEFLHKHFVTKDKIEQYKHLKRLYVIRNASNSTNNHRRIINEKELYPIFKKFDIHPIKMEAVSFQDKINILYNADFIISNQSSSGTNTHFLKNGSKILFILSEEMLYYLSILSIPTFFNDKSKTYFLKVDLADNSPNYYVDPNVLEKKLASIFKD